MTEKEHSTGFEEHRRLTDSLVKVSNMTIRPQFQSKWQTVRNAATDSSLWYYFRQSEVEIYCALNPELQKRLQLSSLHIRSINHSRRRGRGGKKVFSGAPLWLIPPIKSLLVWLEYCRYDVGLSNTKVDSISEAAISLPGRVLGRAHTSENVSWMQRSGDQNKKIQVVERFANMNDICN